jgi:hypothetical protein
MIGARPKQDAAPFVLAYASVVSADAGSRLPSTVEDILLQSVRNNRRDGLSGFLLCDGAHFAQVLEGPRALVEACFARICGDGRHQQVRLKVHGEEGGPYFPRWSMCGLYLSSLDDALLGPAHIDFNLLAAAPGALLQHLRGIAHRHGEALDRAHEQIVARL